jgi:hypothetical protein
MIKQHSIDIIETYMPCFVSAFTRIHGSHKMNDYADVSGIGFWPA